MNRKYLALASRIEAELTDIEILIEKITEGWKHAKKTGDSYYLDSVALNLHGFYSALERVFVLIAQDIDGTIPEGSSWHQDLLVQMKTEIKKVRPTVLTRETYQSLDEYRGFRHIVRNVYTFNLSSDRIEPLVININNVFTDIKKEIGAFNEFIERVGETE